ncbi:chascon [Anaeramoeba flamelloides]|uniref:Chascon n=1 Tax=Anaeramoeba flamelloides TaxID=1746091 RepID=A0ABQ8YEB7_9EUKA|nr:chascon [Anaeramoeba flamelloides]
MEFKETKEQNVMKWICNVLGIKQKSRFEKMEIVNNCLNVFDRLKKRTPSRHQKKTFNEKILTIVKECKQIGIETKDIISETDFSLDSNFQPIFELMNQVKVKYNSQKNKENKKPMRRKNDPKEALNQEVIKKFADSFANFDFKAAITRNESENENERENENMNKNKKNKKKKNTFEELKPINIQLTCSQLKIVSDLGINYVGNFISTASQIKFFLLKKFPSKFQLLLTKKATQKHTETKNEKNKKEKEKEKEEKEEEEEENKQFMRVEVCCKNSFERDLFYKTLTLYNCYPGESPENKMIQGKVLSTQEEITALLTRCIKKKFANYDILLFNETNKEYNPCLLKLNPNSLTIFQKDNEDHKNNMKQIIKIQWEQNFIQIVQAKLDLSEFILKTEIEESKKIQKLRIKCLGRNEKELILKSITSFSSNVKDSNINKKQEQINCTSQKTNFSEQSISVHKLTQNPTFKKKLLFAIDDVWKKFGINKQNRFFALFEPNKKIPIVHQYLEYPFSLNTCNMSTIVLPDHDLKKYRKLLLVELKKKLKNKMNIFNIATFKEHLNNNNNNNKRVKKLKIKRPTLANNIYTNTSKHKNTNIHHSQTEIKKYIFDDINSRIENQMNNASNNEIKVNYSINIKESYQLILYKNKVIIEKKTNFNNQIIINEQYNNKQKIFINPLSKNNFLFINANNNKYYCFVETQFQRDLIINLFFILRGKFCQSNTFSGINLRILISPPINNQYYLKKEFLEKKTKSLYQYNSNYFNSAKNKKTKQKYQKFEINIYNSIEELIELGQILLFKDHFELRSKVLKFSRYYSEYSKILPFFNLYKNKELFCQFNFDEYNYMLISFLNNSNFINFYTKFNNYKNEITKFYINTDSNYFKIFIHNNQNTLKYPGLINVNSDCITIKDTIEILYLDYALNMDISHKAHNNNKKNNKNTGNNNKKKMNDNKKKKNNNNKNKNDDDNNFLNIFIGNGYGSVDIEFLDPISKNDFCLLFETNYNRYFSKGFNSKIKTFKIFNQNNQLINCIISNKNLTIIDYIKNTLKNSKKNEKQFKKLINFPLQSFKIFKSNKLINNKYQLKIQSNYDNNKIIFLYFDELTQREKFISLLFSKEMNNENRKLYKNYYCKYGYQFETYNIFIKTDPKLNIENGLIWFHNNGMVLYQKHNNTYIHNKMENIDLIFNKFNKKILIIQFNKSQNQNNPNDVMKTNEKRNKKIITINIKFINEIQRSNFIIRFQSKKQSCQLINKFFIKYYMSLILNKNKSLNFKLFKKNALIEINNNSLNIITNFNKYNLFINKIQIIKMNIKVLIIVIKINSKEYFNIQFKKWNHFADFFRIINYFKYHNKVILKNNNLFFKNYYLFLNQSKILKNLQLINKDPNNNNNKNSNINNSNINNNNQWEGLFVNLKNGNPITYGYLSFIKDVDSINKLNFKNFDQKTLNGELAINILQIKIIHEKTNLENLRFQIINNNDYQDFSLSFSFFNLKSKDHFLNEYEEIKEKQLTKINKKHKISKWKENFENLFNIEKQKRIEEIKKQENEKLNRIEILKNEILNKIKEEEEERIKKINQEDKERTDRIQKEEKERIDRINKEEKERLLKIQEEEFKREQEYLEKMNKLKLQKEKFKKKKNEELKKLKRQKKEQETITKRFEKIDHDNERKRYQEEQQRISQMEKEEREFRLSIEARSKKQQATWKRKRKEQQRILDQQLIQQDEELYERKIQEEHDLKIRFMQWQNEEKLRIMAWEQRDKEREYVLQRIGDEHCLGLKRQEEEHLEKIKKCENERMHRLKAQEELLKKRILGEEEQLKIKMGKEKEERLKRLSLETKERLNRKKEEDEERLRLVTKFEDKKNKLMSQFLLEQKQIKKITEQEIENKKLKHQQEEEERLLQIKEEEEKAKRTLLEKEEEEERQREMRRRKENEQRLMRMKLEQEQRTERLEKEKEERLKREKEIEMQIEKKRIEKEKQRKIKAELKEQRKREKEEKQRLIEEKKKKKLEEKQRKKEEKEKKKEEKRRKSESTKQKKQRVEKQFATIADNFKHVKNNNEHIVVGNSKETIGTGNDNTENNGGLGVGDEYDGIETLDEEQIFEKIDRTLNQISFIINEDDLLNFSSDFTSSLSSTSSGSYLTSSTDSNEDSNKDPNEENSERAESEKEREKEFDLLLDCFPLLSKVIKSNFKISNEEQFEEILNQIEQLNSKKEENCLNFEENEKRKDILKQKKRDEKKKKKEERKQRKFLKREEKRKQKQEKKRIKAEKKKKKQEMLQKRKLEFQKRREEKKRRREERKHASSEIKNVINKLSQKLDLIVLKLQEKEKLQKEKGEEVDEEYVHLLSVLSNVQSGIRTLKVVDTDTDISDLETEEEIDLINLDEADEWEKEQLKDNALEDEADEDVNTMLKTLQGLSTTLNKVEDGSSIDSEEAESLTNNVKEMKEIKGRKKIRKQKKQVRRQEKVMKKRKMKELRAKRAEEKRQAKEIKKEKRETKRRVKMQKSQMRKTQREKKRKMKEVRIRKRQSMREKLQERNNQIRVKKNIEEEKKRRLEEERIRLLRENAEWFKVVQKNGKQIVEEGSVSVQDTFVCDFKNKGKVHYDLNKDSLVMKKSSNKKVVRIVVDSEISLILYFEDTDSSSKFLKQFNRLKYQTLLKSKSSNLTTREFLIKMSKNNILLAKTNKEDPKSKGNFEINTVVEDLTAEKSDKSEKSAKTSKGRSKKQSKDSLNTRRIAQRKKQKKRSITQRNFNIKDYSKNSKTVRISNKGNTLKPNRKLSKSNSQENLKKNKKRSISANMENIKIPKKGSKKEIEKQVSHQK